MKKIYLLALMAMTLSALSLTSCSKDDDNSGDDKKKEEQQLDKSEWATNIIGTWAYDSGVNTSTRISGDGTSQKKGTLTEQETQGFTVGAGTGTYAYKYVGNTKWEDGTTSDGSFSYSITFTYEYVDKAYDTYDTANLKCTVTKTDNAEMVPVGSDFRICIHSMTKNTGELYTSKTGWVNYHTFTRK